MRVKAVHSKEFGLVKGLWVWVRSREGGIRSSWPGLAQFMQVEGPLQRRVVFTSCWQQNLFVPFALLWGKGNGSDSNVDKREGEYQN